MKIDNRAIAIRRMDAVDYGVVLRHGDGPDECGIYGARDVWVFRDDNNFYILCAAGDIGWLATLATVTMWITSCH